MPFFFIVTVIIVIIEYGKYTKYFHNFTEDTYLTTSVSDRLLRLLRICLQSVTKICDTNPLSENDYNLYKHSNASHFDSRHIFLFTWTIMY